VGRPDEPDLDLAALDAWIADQLPGAGTPLSARRIGQGVGISNALFLIERGEGRWVLRQPPAVKNDSSAANMVREWRILQALEGTPVPHAAPRLLCEDAQVLGAPFLVMDEIVGFTPGFEIPAGYPAHPEVRRQLGMAYVDGLVGLSQVDWRARGLEGLGKPDGFLERQVSRWLGQLDRYRSRPLPELGFLTAWLERNRPVMSPPAIIHGDYSPFNVMVAPDLPVRLAAIIDWDTGTIGDPLLDIGHLLARWTEPGEEPVVTVQAGGADHYPRRAELARRYAERTGRDLSSLPYYECLALFKLAVILEGTYARTRQAGIPDEHNEMAVLVPRLLVAAARFARGELA
jgi:aminoglycoside phosphotransferase (APT) family kinase protein